MVLTFNNRKWNWYFIILSMLFSRTDIVEQNWHSTSLSRTDILHCWLWYFPLMSGLWYFPLMSGFNISRCWPEKAFNIAQWNQHFTLLSEYAISHWWVGVTCPIVEPKWHITLLSGIDIPQCWVDRTLRKDECISHWTLFNRNITWHCWVELHSTLICQQDISQNFISHKWKGMTFLIIEWMWHFPLLRGINTPHSLIQAAFHTVKGNSTKEECRFH